MAQRLIRALTPGEDRHHGSTMMMGSKTLYGKWVCFLWTHSPGGIKDISTAWDFAQVAGILLE